MPHEKISNVNQLPGFVAAGGTTNILPDLQGTPVPQEAQVASNPLLPLNLNSERGGAFFGFSLDDIKSAFSQVGEDLSNFPQALGLGGGKSTPQPKPTTKVEGTGGSNGKTVPLPIDTNALANQLLSPTSGLGNANLKKVTPEGALEFFDDTLVGGKPLTGGEAPTVNQPLESAQGVPSPDLNQDGGFGEFITSPKFRQILAQFGLAISASRPTSFANQLSQFANRSIESEIFNQSVEELLNPSQPASGGGLPSNLALLSPDQQLAAIQLSQGIKQQARQGKSADVVDRLRTAQTIDILRGDTPATKNPSSRVETFKEIPDGKGGFITAPPGKLFKNLFDNETGQFSKRAGLIDEPKTTGGDDKRRQIKASELEQLQENTILAFDTEIKEGIGKLFGRDIASSGQLLDFLRTGEFGSPLDVSQRALAQNPTILNEFNKMIAESVERLEGDESLSVARAIEQNVRTRSENVKTKGTLGGVRTSKEASK